jgi:hypothetical protein
LSPFCLALKGIKFLFVATACKIQKIRENKRVLHAVVRYLPAASKVLLIAFRETPKSTVHGTGTRRGRVRGSEAKGDRVGGVEGREGKRGWGREVRERMGVGRSDRSCTCDLIPFSSIDSIWPTI